MVGGWWFLVCGLRFEGCWLVVCCGCCCMVRVGSGLLLFVCCLLGVVCSLCWPSLWLGWPMLAHVGLA